MTTAACADDCKPIADRAGQDRDRCQPHLRYQPLAWQNRNREYAKCLLRNLLRRLETVPYDDAERAARKIAACQGKKADCALRGLETIGDRAVQHYTATEHLKNGDVSEEYWIAVDGGQFA